MSLSGSHSPSASVLIQIFTLINVHLKMNASRYFPALVLCMIPIGCGTSPSPATAGFPIKTQSSRPEPREANRYEFVESELVQHPEDEIKLNHYYMGSRDGYDYISVRGRRYKIPGDQLKLNKAFPLTENSAKWIPLRIHFSRVDYVP